MKIILGGGVYVGLLLSINHFTSQYAAPIASFVIMICSGMILICGIKYHLYLEKPNEEMFIDYELGNLLVPITLLGSKVGCLLNLIMPDIVTCVFLLVVLAYNTFNSTYSR